MDKLKIAFTGPGNTGKSTIIQKLHEELSKRLSVVIYPETARIILDGMSDDFNMENFQGEICKLENERALQLKEDIADVMLIDRTSLDGFVYSLFNVHSGKGFNLQQENIAEYDLVVLFTGAFKQTNTEQFAHYNDDRLVELFRNIMKFAYGDKLIEMKNGRDYDKIKERISELIEEKR